MQTGHTRRVITALVFLPVLLLALVFRGWVEFGLLAVLTAAGLWEFYSMFWKQEEHVLFKLSGMALGVGILWASMKDQPWVLVGILIASLWIANLWFLLRYAAHADSVKKHSSYGYAAVHTAGLLYIPVLLQFLLHFEQAEIILLLLAVCASDIGAYYCGAFFGGPRLWPAVSPKKTWSGSLGGGVASILVCLVMGAVDEYGLSGAGQGRPWWMWALLGTGLNIAAQFGDLFESSLKRHLAVKDSGKLLPGHGGVLDRIDSLLLAISAYAGLDALFHFFN